MKHPLKTAAGVLAASSLIFALAAEDAPKAPRPGAPAGGASKLRVLIVTGDDVPAHDWKETTPITREILEKSGRFEVRVSEKPADLAAEDLSAVDVVILSFRDGPGREVPESARKKLLDFVASGKGLVAVHFAVAAMREWKEYAGLVGRVWVPRKSGHGPRGVFKVSVTRKDHPITAGLPDFEADDELYAALEGAKELNVLATAHSADFSKKDEPMAWTLDAPKGRVFVTVLGHDAKARRHPAFGTLLARGAEWAATGKVTLR